MLRTYESDRSRAIWTTLALPNVGRAHAAWKRFRRLLKQRAQREERRQLNLVSRVGQGRGGGYGDMAVSCRCLCVGVPVAVRVSVHVGGCLDLHHLLLRAQRWKAKVALPPQLYDQEVAPLRSQASANIKAAAENNATWLDSTLEYANEFDASIFDDEPGTEHVSGDGLSECDLWRVYACVSSSSGSGGGGGISSTAPHTNIAASAAQLHELPSLEEDSSPGGRSTARSGGGSKLPIGAVEENQLEARMHAFDAYAGVREHSGQRGLVSHGGLRSEEQLTKHKALHGTEHADLARHAFAVACNRQNVAPLPVMPAPYLFGEQEAGRVDLGNRHVGNNLAIAVCEGLQSVAKGLHVRQVNLAGNGLTEAVVPAIAGLLTVHEATLTGLDLSSNPIGAVGAMALAGALEGNIFLKELQLSNCGIKDQGSAKLMPIIAELSDLTTLNISKNGISKPGSEYVGEMLERTLYLENLDLSWNALGPKGCERVVRALSNNKTIRRLGLAFNSAGDAVMKLEEVLQDGVLEEIDLSNNQINEKQAQVISGLLKRSKTLKRVKLSKNPIGKRGGRAMFKALLVLEAFGVSVDLSGCDLGSEDKTLHLFDPANPNGDYNLDLTDPYDEFVGHELVELAWLEEGENWQNEMLDGKPYNLQEPEDLGIEFGRSSRLVDYFELPDEGVLTLRYASTRRRPKPGEEATDKQVC
jgi:hypothetical protein